MKLSENLLGMAECQDDESMKQYLKNIGASVAALEQRVRELESAAESALEYVSNCDLDPAWQVLTGVLNGDKL